MKIAIIGGGLTGLSAGYFLVKEGHQITIFEKSGFLGGLAGSFSQKGWLWPLEFYFHHIFTSDKDIINLTKELGIENKLFFSRPRTSIFRSGQTFPFDSPFSVLKLPLLPFSQKLRVGLITTYLKLVSDWKKFEGFTADKWLKKYYGQKPYETLWEPLLKSKFGEQVDKISMAWFWARIKKRSQKLGYFKGGFQVLIDKLAEKIKENGGKILLNQEIKNLKELVGYERVIFSGPIPVFLKIASGLPQNYRKKLQKLEMTGALNLVLILKEKFLTDNTYWLNINEPNFPFVAAVEHTNFINPKYYGGGHILYIGGYYPQNHRYFKMTKEEIFKEFLPYLGKINPNFNQSAINNYQLAMTQYAQPIIPTNYSKLLPPLETPIPNVYLATMHHIFPWDRGTNYAVKLGNKVANEVSKT